MIALIIGILLSFWIWPTVKKGGGNPVGWVIGTLIIWPVFSTIVGVKYKSRGLTVVGILGLLVIVGFVVYLAIIL